MGSKNGKDEKKSKRISEIFKKLKKNQSLFRILKMVKKEYRLAWTDKFNLFLALILPPLIIVLIAIASTPSTKINPVKVAVISYDSNTFINPNDYVPHKIDNYSLPYLNAVNKSQYLALLNFYNASEETSKYAMETARKQLISGEIEVIIVIPIDFSEMLSWGYPGMLECILDSSNMMHIQEKLNAVQDSVKIFVRENNLSPQFVLKGFKEYSIPVEYNSQFNYMTSLVLPLMVFGLAVVLSILVIVKEKPIARLLLTPVHRFEILLSKYITYLSIIILQAIVLIISSLLSGLYIVGSIFDFFMALLTIGFTGLAMGLFISSISKTKTEANQLFFACFIVIVMLSGMFIPIGAMPEYLQLFAYILPLSHGGPMLDGIVSKGNSFIGFDFFWLIGLSAFLFVASLITFNRRKYEA